MGAVTYGDVLAGRARPEELVPFGGEQAHKAFALAVGLQLLVDALVPDDAHGAVLLVARPEAIRCRRFARSRAASGCRGTEGLRCVSGDGVGWEHAGGVDGQRAADRDATRSCSSCCSRSKARRSSR